MHGNKIVDYSALRTNQAFIIGLLALAFLLDVWALVAFVSVVMLVGTVFPALSLFKLVYRGVLRPLNLVRPDPIEDNAAPHQFSQLLGGLFNAAATVSLLLGATVTGWTLAGVVVALASLNLFGGFCVGCFFYYQLARVGAPGFSATPIDQTVLPGRRPQS